MVLCTDMLCVMDGMILCVWLILIDEDLFLAADLLAGECDSVC